MSTPQWPSQPPTGGQPAPGSPYSGAQQQPNYGQSRPGYQPDDYPQRGNSPQGPPSGGYPAQPGYAAAPSHGYAPASPYQQDSYQQNSYQQNSYQQDPSQQSSYPDETVYDQRAFSAAPWSSPGFPAATPGTPVGAAGSPIAIVGAVLLLLGGALSAILAALSWAEVNLDWLDYRFGGTVFGIYIPAFLETSIDIEILFSAAIVLGIIVAVLAIMLFARRYAARIPLAIFGLIGSAYFAWETIYIVSETEASEAVVPGITLLVWLVGSILLLLPAAKGSRV